ncbi:Uncharacterised protein [Mycobacteroides abscessus subsp. abscessus]|uniref:hypothetical protein n=1 Tax=Mycobacteroides abscessus TaxID=36809 RepID=UPI00092AC077|nr:hypothetical protein [Mycobacteroides abscessus]SIC52442.1 Uncharacterised protein [Mycobacteroides abscessus subsp. abscessus]SIC96048.1 Uncharacterised protein [Mycobacteroides abscessus subsp. abscessus]SID25123.1 Uncharacterised protein [Mycobacteroides abscessus subsp. abscessus]SKV97650.1 Uncharacterised protein [Mycobacteroides abscessus subsp. abscessus]SKW02352.1 Uncharacterised protein [Mycobacteroides abscessus subsp. abscessus]
MSAATKTGQAIGTVTDHDGVTAIVLPSEAGNTNMIDKESRSDTGSIATLRRRRGASASRNLNRRFTIQADRVSDWRPSQFANGLPFA